jgi:hypothetical protein
MSPRGGRGSSGDIKGISGIAGALNMLPKIFLREGMVNPNTNKIIKIYQADGDYQKFYRNFVGGSNNGRSIMIWRSSLFVVLF